MLKILLRKQLYELNSSFFYDRKKGRVRSKGTSILLIVLYALLMIVIMGGIFTMLSVMLCAPFVGMGLDWLYFDMMTLIALFLGVFGGVFNTYSSLYKARDNDLMLSLPIPTRYVLISRLTGVYLMGLMFSAVVMLPAVIVYFVVAHPAVEGVVGSLLLTVLVSVFVFILSCLLGWVVAKISVHLKSRSLIVVILSLVFFGLYYFVCFNAYELLQELIVNALTVMMAVGICVIGAMNDLTAPSISLEGKSLWIAQSLPVRPQEVLHAKLRLHMLLTVIPELFCSACVCILLRPDLVTGVLCVILPPVFTLSVAAFGLVVNLKKPNLSWQTEAVAVKQSIGILIAMLGGWAIAAVLGAAYYLLYAKLGSAAFLALAIAVLTVLSVLELKWINTRGSEIFRYL